MRPNADARPTINSLGRQENVDLQVLIHVDVDGMGANWARNRGALRARHPYLLFCDDDIVWRPGALALMASTLDEHPEAAYAYGAYEMAGRIQCEEFWSEVVLRKRNFISTMTMIRREAFPGFDEECQRLQDWDLWLTMLAAGHRGIQCGQVLFDTAERDGITRNGPCDYMSARAWVARKHNLNLWTPKETK